MPLFRKSARHGLRCAPTVGRCFAHLQPDRKGDPELPLPDQALEDKFRNLASPVVIGRSPAQALLEKLWALDRVERV